MKNTKKHAENPKSKPMTTAQIHTFFSILRAQNPHPTTELEYTSVFELLTTVMLSAQATDVSVNKATRRLFPIANTPEQILALGTEKLESFIQSIGLFKSKARHLMQTCQILIDKHESSVPRTRQALEALPGVGRKTANVILNTAFREPTIAVDTHLFRLGNRTGLAIGNTPLIVEMALLKRVPKEFLLDSHHWLILHGRYVCTARLPQCQKCAVSHVCQYPLKHQI